MRRYTTSLFGVLGVLALLGGCSQETVSVPVPSFDRPGAMTFACLDRDAAAFVALSECEGADGLSHSLLAFVAQTSRGELATVDLTAGRVIDLDVRVPGDTFARTGEVPVAVVTPENAPALTYVANYGSRTISVIPTARLHPDADNVTAAATEISLPGPPTDLAISPDEAFLYVTVPSIGGLLEFPITSEGLGASRSVELRVTAGGVRGADASTAEFKACSETARLGNPAAPPAPPEVVAGGTPSPESIFVDAEEGRLLVADSLLPLVHIVELGSTGGVVSRDPYNVGVSVSQVVLTPTLPDALLGATGMVRFGYAIDSADGSVLAFDASSGSATEGGVISVDEPIRVTDRVGLAAGARTLEVLTPGFPGESCASSDDAGAEPGKLRGVFLGVGLNDGTLRIVDVHDLDAPCRAGTQIDAATSSCDFATGSAEAEVFIRRHRPRIAEVINSSVRVSGSPRFTLNGSTQSFLSTGATEREGYPSLQAIPGGCAEGQRVAFPVGSTEPPLICTLADPWANQSESWVASWEGALPNTDRYVGTLDGDALIVFGDPNFCSLGTLDEEAGPEAVPGYTGDMLVITALPDDGKADCAPFAADSAGRRALVAFAVREAYPERLVLGESRGAYTLADAQSCFGANFSFDIRSGGAFTVTGSFLGLQHGVGTDEGTGRCRVGSTDARHGRALPESTFNNSFVSFFMGAFADSAPPEDDAATGLAFSITGIPSQLGLDIGSAPMTLRFLSLDDHLYCVDASSSGLAEVQLTEFKLERSFQ